MPSRAVPAAGASHSGGAAACAASARSACGGGVRAGTRAGDRRTAPASEQSRSGAAASEAPLISLISASPTPLLFREEVHTEPQNQRITE
eukprot:scaffold229260_cov24-Tisochrysis_lutea.AAC.3